MYIFGLSGTAQSGKDTFAEALHMELVKSNITCRVHHLAFPIKRIATEFFGISPFDVESSSGKTKKISHLGNITVREVLQKLGTEVGRNIYQDIWLWYLFDKRLKDSKVKALIIPDIRFKNEYNYLLNKKAYMIKTIRSDFKIKESDHISENDLNEERKWHWVCKANSVECVKENARTLASYIIKKQLHLINLKEFTHDFNNFR